MSMSCVYIHMYIYIYMYMYFCMYMCVGTYVCTHIYTCIRIYVCVYVHIYVCVYMYTYIYIYIYIYVYIYICIYIHIYLYIFANIYICTHIFIYIYVQCMYKEYIDCLVLNVLLQCFWLLVILCMHVYARACVSINICSMTHSKIQTNLTPTGCKSSFRPRADVWFFEDKGVQISFPEKQAQRLLIEGPCSMFCNNEIASLRT